MKKNRIGNTDIEATHLSFGGIKLHSNMPDKAENIVSSMPCWRCKATNV
jgi:hypothetical protein